MSIENPFVPPKSRSSNTAKLVEILLGPKEAERARRAGVGSTEKGDSALDDELSLDERAEDEQAELKKLNEIQAAELRLRFPAFAEELDVLNKKFADRFKAFGKEKDTVTVSVPELPPNLTQEHLDTINEVLGGKLEPRILPSLEDLHDLDAAYADVMYPVTQSAEDTKNGLVSYRSSSWNIAMSISGHAFTDHPTYGEAYLHSMRLQLQDIGGSLVLLDTATKPSHRYGLQGCGTVEGADKTADPLLPLFQEAFGLKANRFNHSYKAIQEKLLPLAKKKIADALKEKGLSDVSFDVILVPATLENLDLTFHHLKSSTTDTSEWTSTILKDDEGIETGYSLLVGGSGRGGAAYVNGRDVAGSGGYLGARLAVVFKRN